ELIQEAVLVNVDLVPVLGGRGVLILITDIADLDRHVARNRTLDTKLVGMRVRELQVRIENADAVVDGGRQWVRHGDGDTSRGASTACRARWRRAQAFGLSEQQRPAIAAVRCGIAG